MTQRRAIQALCDGVAVLQDLPYFVGPMPASSNPMGLPITMPLILERRSSGALRQCVGQELESVLKSTYAMANPIGVPLRNEASGCSYLAEFSNLVEQHAPPPGRVLEIGPGKSTLAFWLRDLGWAVDVVEPGIGYGEELTRQGIRVFPELFPSVSIAEEYDMVIAYLVLEHAFDTTLFLTGVAQRLRRGGVFLLAVPDCTEEIRHGDPAMLLHEHISYYTPESLMWELRAAGFRGGASLSKFGRLIFGAVKLDQKPSDVVEPRDWTIDVERMHATLPLLRQRVAGFARRGSLGVFVPARGLALLHAEQEYRFFDDADWLHGQYIPPFDAVVEGSCGLVSNPVDTVLILSRSFEDAISLRLRSMGVKSRIVRYSELWSSPSTS